MEQEITFLPENLKLVPTDKVRPNTWNPKDKDTPEFRKVVESLKAYGQRQPIVVRENNGYEIIDGEQRWRACNELGFKNVLVYNEGKVEDKRAQELTLWYQVQAPFNEVKLAGLIVKLVVDFPDTTIPFTPEQIEEMKDLVKFDWDKYKINTTPTTDSGPVIKTLVVPMTEEQYNMVQDAIHKIKDEAEQKDMTDGRALELMAGDYLAGFGVKGEEEK